MDDFERRVEEEKLAALIELAYGASHEINNPLANIATRAQVLLRDEPRPERRRMLCAIHAQAMRAHEMIADLMLFARPPRLDVSDVDLNALVRQTADEWRSRAEEQSTELAISTGGGHLSCPADATQLAVAIGALVRNALEALGSGGRIELRVQRSDEKDGHPAGASSALPSENGDRHPAEASPRFRALPLAVIVCDNGPGMSPELRQRAFDPFFSGREAGRGLGFGLSKCWRIVRDHGGEVLLDSELGTGTQVTLRLPSAAPADSKHLAASAAEPSVAPAVT